ncbi:MAG: UvrD-helicase domain-containing protein [Magnetococcus sp. YQC-5]
MPPPLADANARQAALDPSRSFIVQAPAGSGKTGLLTQRFLRLLALSDHPEEVIAVTYTRKAASEMRTRILDGILLAAGPAPEEPHTRLTWVLGREALVRDQQLGWHLTEHPGRLRILTIDALCASLVRQAPALSGFGGRPAVAEEPSIQYRRAARATLRLADGDSRWAPMVTALLDHQDNNWSTAETLLTGMLARRDQWLRRIMGGEPLSRDSMEAILQAILEHGLAQVAAAIPPLLRKEMMDLARFASLTVMEKNPDSKLGEWREQQEFPTSQFENASLWFGLGELLLTGGGTWRKQFNILNGFPPPTAARSPQEGKLFKEMKARAIHLTQTSLMHCESLRQALLEIRQLPPPHYSDQQWKMLEILLELLPMAAGQLKLIFAQTDETDFVEAAMGAALALGDPEEPSDLALRLDYRIRHILVDEFQDASHGQFDLLRRLTAGWTGDDGRTLFVVGDPMQSIYRFREADVGLFLKARREGIGAIALVPLSLSVNFRSDAKIVQWVNTTFPNIFPAQEDEALGGVSYTVSHAFHPMAPDEAVTFYPAQNAEEEAQYVATVAADARANNKNVAILVRSRTHVPTILMAMRQAGLRYRAVELDPLSSRPAVRDLMTLTRALSHPADRIAWLALLRAPWCGLTLEDLHLLADKESKTTIWERVQDDQVMTRLSTDGATRLLLIREKLRIAVQRRRRMPGGAGQGQLRRLLETTWHSLGGAATLASQADLADAKAFFDLVESMERGGEIPDFTIFSSRLAELKAGLDPDSDPGLLVMTIHKAKGLEFDVVILPALHKKPRGEDKQLLSWLENPPGSRLGQGGLLLAPVKRSDQDEDDPIHAYVRRIERIKAEHETGRLLYVAVTRAKRHLHLTGTPPPVGSEAATGSFLRRLVGADPSRFATEREVDPVEEEASEEAPSSRLPTVRRLIAGWRVPPPPPGIPNRFGLALSDQTEKSVEFDWAGESVRMIGMVVHRYLMVIANEGLDAWPVSRIHAMESIFMARLMQLGADLEGGKEMAQQVMMALVQTLEDPRGRWILADTHPESGCEFKVTGVVEGRLVRAVMDRWLVDEEGVRWIIDFKTSRHTGGNLEGFLDNEQVRYQEQLRRYGLLMKHLFSGPVRLGLYFPVHAGWRESAFE